jgi:radical SAM superfamily enzyme YgiQ (UPF0313 family)
MRVKDRSYINPNIELNMKTTTNSTSKLNILLITPTALDSNGKPIKRKKLMVPAVTMAAIAAVTPGNSNIKLIYETVEEIPYDGNWDIVGLTGMGSGTVRAWQIAGEFKRKKSKAITVLGGIGPSIIEPELSLKYVDSLVIGEAEDIWPKLIEDFQKGELKKIYRMDSPPQISNIPFPRTDLINTRKINFMRTVQATRGCPMRCGFCSISAFFKGSYRTKPVNSVVQDIRHAKKTGSRYFAFLDDNIYGDQNYCKELFEALIPEKIIWVSQCSINITKEPDMLSLARKSGCRLLSFGLETVEPSNLEKFNKSWNHPEEYKNAFKITREHGIEVSVSMMIGADDDTIYTFQNIYNFIMDNHIVLPKLYILTPMPGTPFYDLLKAENRIISHDLRKYTGGFAVFRPKNFSPEILEKKYWELYNKIHTRVNICRRLRNNPANLGIIVRLGILMTNLHYKSHIAKRIVPGLS